MLMIVENKGYLSVEQVLNLLKRGEHFCVYETNKKTHILVAEAEAEADKICLYFPKYDRLPWKLLEGKKITNGTKVFDSIKNNIEELDTSKWNGGKQLMSYTPYNLY